MSVRMLSPQDFPELPKNISQYLQQRGCEIPQPPPLKKVPRQDAPSFFDFQRKLNDKVPAEKYNVVSGPFFEREKTDWAVLCSEKGSSAILIFRDSSIEKVDELGRADDSAFQQTLTENGKEEFSRIIYSVTLDTGYIVRTDENGERLTPRGIYGVEDAFVEKASTIWYHKNGQWKEAPGSD